MALVLRRLSVRGVMLALLHTHALTVLGAGASPPINFERTRIELGAISDFDKSTQTFAFVNTSSAPVRIEIGGCHFCGVPTSDKEVYQPGDRGIIFVEVNPAGRRGVMRAGGTVTVPGLEGFRVDLEVGAEVHPRVFVHPDDVRIREIVRPSGGETTFSICGRTGDFNVSKVGTDASWLTLTMAPVRVAEDMGDSCRCFDITARVGEGLPIGDHGAEVRIETSDAMVASRVVSMSVSVVSDAAAEPAQLMAQPTTPDAAFEERFVVRSRMGAPLRGASIDILERGLLQQLVVDAWPSARGLEVRVSGRTPARAINFTRALVGVRTLSADGQEELLAVPIGASVRAAAAPAATPIERDAR